MYDSLNHCLRRWEHLRESSEITRLGKGKVAFDWVERDVMHLVISAFARADFRELARWPIKNLLPGSQSECRKLIDEIDRGLVQTARNMVKVLRRSSIRLALQSDQPVSTPVPAQTKPQTVCLSVPSGASSGRGVQIVENDDSMNEPVDLHASLVSSMNKMSLRPWHDLVAETDFFGPLADLNLISEESWFGPGSAGVRFSEFLPYCNPALRLPGDFIGRCLEIRIEYWRSVLRRVFVQVQNAINRAGSQCPAKDVLAWKGTIVNLNPAIDRLQQILKYSSAATQRNAAMTLLQLYASVAKGCDLNWLGSVAYRTMTSTFVYWLRERDNLAFADAIAGALLTLANRFRSPPDIDSIVEAASKDHRLCLVDSNARREVYWAGELLDINWERQRRAWTLLIALATDLKAGRSGIDNVSDLGISLRHAYYDLKRDLPGAFANVICVSSNVYSLQLRSAETAIVRINVDESATTT